MAYTIGTSDPAELAAFNAGAPAFLPTNQISPANATVGPRWTEIGRIIDPDITDPDFPISAIYDASNFYFSKSNNVLATEQFVNVQLFATDVDTILFRVEQPDDETHTVSVEIANDIPFTTDVLVLLPPTTVTGSFRFELSGSVVYEDLEHIRLRITKTGTTGPILSVTEFAVGKRIVLDSPPLAPFADRPRNFAASRVLSRSRGFTQNVYANGRGDNEFTYDFCEDELPKLAGVRSDSLSGSRAFFSRLSKETGWMLGRFDSMNFFRASASRHSWAAQFNEQAPFRAAKTETIFESVEATTNFIDKYPWDDSYEGPGVSGTNWPSAGSGVTFTTAGTAPTTGVSTSLWSNLPARMVDEAMRPGNDDLTNALFDWVSSNFQMRMLFELDPSVAVNSVILRYIVSGTRLLQITVASQTSIRFTVTHLTSGGSYVRTVTIPTGPVLIDWRVSAAQMSVFVNGTDVSPTAHTGAIDFANGPDSAFLLGISGATVPAGDFLFFGWLWTQSISFAEHQADVLEAGV